MSAQHTPGPWTTNGDPYVSTGDGKRPIAFCGTRYGHEDRANARLIAAAPELLSELVIARRKLAALHQAYIATVTNPTTGLIDDPDDVVTVEADQDLLNGIDAAIAKATTPAVQRLPSDDTEGGAS